MQFAYRHPFIKRLQPLFVSAALACSAACQPVTVGIAPPVADAGIDQVVVQGDSVTLNGSRSRSSAGKAGGLSYAWRMIARPAQSAAQLDPASGAQPTFVSDSEGVHIFELVVTDSATDLASDPDYVNVMVRSALTVSWVVPPNRATGVPLQTALALEFSMPVQPESVHTGAIGLSSLQGPVQAVMRLEENQRTVVLTPTEALSADTLYRLVVSQGVTDTWGNALATPHVTSFTTVGVGGDTTPPYVAQISPTGAAVPGDPVSVVFSEPVRAVSLDSSSLRVVDTSTSAQVAGTVELRAGGASALFVPLIPWTGGLTYEVTVAASIVDIAGNALDGDRDGVPGGDHVFEFTVDTATDSQSPEVVAVSPGDQFVGVSLGSAVIVTFSEAVKATSVSAVSFTLTQEGGSGVAVPAVVTLDVTRRVARLLPEVRLQPGQLYGVTVAGSVTDLLGNALAGSSQGLPGTSFQSVFTTGVPTGVTGVVSAVSPIFPGQTLRIEVEDSDLDDSPVPDSASLTVISINGETETVALLETGPVSGVFSGALATAFDDFPPGLDDNGTLIVRAGDTVTVTYNDLLISSGGSESISADVSIVGGFDGIITVVNAGSNLMEISVTDEDALANASSSTDVLSCGSYAPCVHVSSPTTGDSESLPLLVEGQEGVFTVQVSTAFSAVAVPDNGVLEIAGAGSVVASYTDALRANGDNRGFMVDASTAIALDHVTIRDAADGEGSAVGPVTLSTDGSLRLYAAGYDAQGTYLGDQVVQWMVSGNIGQVLPATGDTALFDATSVGFGQVSVTHPDNTITGDDTGLIEVIAGDIEVAVIRDAAGGLGSEVATLSLTADDARTLFAAGYDADGNFVSDTSVNWEVAGGIGNVTPSVGTTTQFDATAVGVGRLKARPSSTSILGDETGDITVSGGTLARVDIYSSAAGDPTQPLDDIALTSDDLLELCAAGFDGDGNYLNDHSVSWSVAGGIGQVSPSTGSCTSFDAGAVGSGQVLANHATAADDATGTLTISSGNVDTIILRDAAAGAGNPVGPVGITTDATILAFAAGYDAAGNYLGDRAVTWSVIGAIGSVTPAGDRKSATFDPTAPGSGTLQVVDDISGSTYGSGILTVTAGALATLEVRVDAGCASAVQGAASRTTDAPLTVYAVGLDADGNCRGDESVNWSVQGGIGSVSAVSGYSVVFDPTTPGAGTVRASHTAAGFDDTGTLTILAGALASIEIRNQSNDTPLLAVSIDVGNTINLYVAGFDADNNLLSPNPSATWSLVGAVGIVSPLSGSTTVYTAGGTSGTSGQVHAQSGAFTDDSGVIQLTTSPALLDYVKILDAPGCTGSSANGGEVGAATITTDEVQVFYAVGFDPSNNCLGDISVTWSTSGGGTLDAGPNSSTQFDPTVANGSATISVSHSTATGDSTGVYTINPGALAYILVRDASNNGGSLVLDRAMAADAPGFTLYAAGYDSDDNYLGDASVSWSITGDAIGTLSVATGSNTTLTLSTVGTGVVTANHATAGVVDDSTGNLTVSAGGVASIVLMTAPGGAGTPIAAYAMTTDETLVVYAVGFDADSNFVSDEAVTWSQTGGIGVIAAGPSSSATFDARTVGTGTVNATHATVAGASTGQITVSGGALVSISVMDAAGGAGAVVAARTYSTDQSDVLYAAGFDADSNYIGDQSVTWSVLGGIGAVAPSTGSSTTLSINAIGSGSVLADHANTAVADGATGALDAVGGALAYVLVRGGPSGGGAEVDTLNLTADDQVTLYAAGYDGDDNYLADQPVAWTVTNSIGTLAPSDAPSTIFYASSLGTGVVTANHASGSVTDDSTGAWTVSAGAPDYILIRDADSGGGAVVGDQTLNADQTLGLFAAAYDADDNYISNLTVDWQVLGGIGSTSPTTSPTTLFDARTIGSGSVRAVHASATNDDTGTIVVSAGAASTLLVRNGAGGGGVVVGDLTLAIADSETFYAAGYDFDGNYAGDQPADWALNIASGALTGSVSPSTASTSTVFSPDAEGEATLTASMNGTSPDSTGNMTVVTTTAPVVSTASPATVARNSSAVTVTITGQNYDCAGAGPTVLFLPGGHVVVDSVDGCAAGQIDLTVSVPCGGATGNYDILVTNPGGQFGIGTSLLTVTTATEGPFSSPSCSDLADNDCDGSTDAIDTDCVEPTFVTLSCDAVQGSPGPSLCTIDLDGVTSQQGSIICSATPKITQLFYDPFDDFSQWPTTVSGTPQISSILATGSAAFAESFSGATVGWEVERTVDTTGMDRVCLDFRVTQRDLKEQWLRIQFNTGGGWTTAFEFDANNVRAQGVSHDDVGTAEADWFGPVCPTDISAAAGDNSNLRLRLAASTVGGKNNNRRRIFIDDMVMTGMAGIQTTPMACDGLNNLNKWTDSDGTSSSPLSIRNVDGSNMASSEDDGDVMQRCFSTVGTDVVDMEFDWVHEDEDTGHHIKLNLSTTGAGGPYSPVIDIWLDADERVSGTYKARNELWDYMRLLRLTDFDPTVADNADVCVQFEFANGDPGNSRWLSVDNICVDAFSLATGLETVGVISDDGAGQYSFAVTSSQPLTADISCTWQSGSSVLTTDCIGGNSCPSTLRFTP